MYLNLTTRGCMGSGHLCAPDMPLYWFVPNSFKLFLLQLSDKQMNIWRTLGQILFFKNILFVTFFFFNHCTLFLISGLLSLGLIVSHVLSFVAGTCHNIWYITSCPFWIHQVKIHVNIFHRNMALEESNNHLAPQTEYLSL